MMGKKFDREAFMHRHDVHTHLMVNFMPTSHTERLEECLLAIELANKGLWDERIEITHWFKHLPKETTAFVTVREIVESEELERAGFINLPGE